MIFRNISISSELRYTNRQIEIIMFFSNEDSVTRDFNQILMRLDNFLWLLRLELKKAVYTNFYVVSSFLHIHLLVMMMINQLYIIIYQQATKKSYETYSNLRKAGKNHIVGS